ncbi:G-type lectin S-receptor-like serine/threonine-protein kinase [Apostasia shenzhenica]|uniref:G-type lectin S-receptor-like serine/threonine-protein kinase n=1 Tax=Apostasia shenzhenica TaxID=1088818 RepID=A0A2I0A1N4_9ASPA|nr:G-type lectin S-receptor-like serine/threonine-protein kinase [Apostasia shenzhenica]
MSNSSSSSNSPSSSGTSGRDTAISIISILVGGTVVIVVTYLVIKCVQRIKMQKINSYHRSSFFMADESMTRSFGNASMLSVATIERFIDDIQKEKPIRFTSQHLSEFTNNFAQKLGQGGFGVAYKGKLPNGILVAVKVLHRTQDKKAEELFMAEVGTIGKTYHINLLRLYGFCFDPEMKALIYEYMENSSLDRYLFNKNYKIEYVKLYDIAIGTAKGIRYLHEECQQIIIHYDIKPGNILLDENFLPKVADFGLAKLCSRDASHVTNSGARGTPGYAAPEMWLPLPVTQKCDVYSFGMLLFEIVGGRRNLDFNENESQEWFPKWVWQKHQRGEMRKMITSVGGIKDIEIEKIERMCRVGLWCVQYKPEARPSMSKVVRMLEGEEEIVEPPNPFHYLDVHDTGFSLHIDNSSNGSTSTSSDHQNSRSL